MDAIDLRLVELLRDNARLSFAELARKVGLSAPGGARAGRQARVQPASSAATAPTSAPEPIGLGVTALIGIVEESTADPDDVIEALRELPEIEACYFLAGAGVVPADGPGRARSPSWSS